MTAQIGTKDESQLHDVTISMLSNHQIIPDINKESGSFFDLVFEDPQDKMNYFSAGGVSPLSSSQALHWQGLTPTEAAVLLLERASILVGAPIPLQGSQGYRSLDHLEDSPNVVIYMALAAEKLLELKDYRRALLWATEALTVYDSMYHEITKDSPIFGWITPRFPRFIHYFSGIFALRSRARVLRHLGNTGASISYIMRAVAIVGNLPAWSDFIALINFLYCSCLSEFRILVHCRHPEPSLISRLNIVDKTLHINGSWKKIHLQASGGVTPRFGASVFVYDGHLYILGGEKNSNIGPFYFDFWRLDLQKLDKWQLLPVCPLPRSTRSISNQNVAVWNHTAYYFTGSQTLYCFDLKQMCWSKLVTTFQSDDVLKGTWPYLQDFREFTMNCVDGRLYIFGGFGPSWNSVQGSNLFMELNITTRKWKRLSGTPLFLDSTIDSPGPRVSAISWVAPEQTKIYIAYGHTNRMAANALKGLLGINYPYDDIWSWDIKKKHWNQERLRGNSPGPRSEMAAVYSSKLDKLILFGGYNPTAPYRTDTVTLRFSYLADTFVCDINTKSLSSSDDPTERAMGSTNWRQVLTRGFPTYRARASLVEDPISSKIYLFSGYFEQEILPSLEIKGDVKCFADIWELRLDLPGGNFDGVDVEEEARTAKTGPWQRCFSCGSVGSWRKCKGACNGRAFFCDRECLKDGWKEHKDMHGCRKVT